MKIKGIRKAASATKGVNGRFYVQISLDTNSGELITSEHVGNSWTQYDDPAIIHVANALNPMSMTDIKQAVDSAIAAMGSKV